ncbi:MAG TPA: class I SAM-dependent methyltransferase [Ktedonosporobacter sp.]|nr:class I SAM-dependent methyltransferase [Ktedonosporobacter sp.]
MTPLSEPHKNEHPSAYFVQDRSNEEEMTRLHLQDQLLTASMGGVLLEQTEPESFRRVLDVGCGTGDWLLEVAKTSPSISLLIGVDISKKMVDYARHQAEVQGVSDRVEFHVMDALRMLEFPTSFFDLVNQRFGASFVRTWEWPKLLDEYKRVCKRGGVIRVTEADFLAGSSSPAFSHLNQLFLEAFHQSGRYYTPDGNAVISQLVRLLSQHDIRGVQTRAYRLDYRAGTPSGDDFVENQKLIFRTALPFLRRWLRVPDNYEEIYQQMLVEMQQPDFVATWELLTAWGAGPGYDLIRNE